MPMAGKQTTLFSFVSRTSATSTKPVADEETGSDGEVSLNATGGSSSAESSGAKESCECQCCAFPGTPYQPADVSESKTTHSHSCKERQHGQVKSYSRKIQPSWYKRYPWISVCTSRYKIFCATCCGAKQQGILTFTRHKSTAFVNQGFGSWNKAIERFTDHERCEMHKEAVEKLAAKSSGANVATQLRIQSEATQTFHREMLMKLLSSIRFLARQGLSFRGHTETCETFEGNLYQLLLLRSEESPQMREWLSKKEYISPDIVNELIKIMGQTVLRSILAQIRSSMWFSLIADEASDISKNEHMCISIRWVNGQYEVNEDPLGLIQLPDTKAETLFSVLKDVLCRCSLPIAMCRGQAYDGASNMSGIRNGVQALVKRETDRALYVHCFAHSLNLCVQEVSKTVDLIRNVMEFIYELVQLIKFSPKRTTIFSRLKKEVSLSNDHTTSPSLRTLCPTRWTVRHGSIESILLNYTVLQDALEEIQKGRDEYAAKAHGMLIQMEMFDTFFGLKLAHFIFSSAEQFSVNLQAKETTVQEALHGAELLVRHLRSNRNESRFDFFYSQVLEQSSALTDEPKLPRYRKIPRRLDEGENPHRYLNPKDRYRHCYFEAIELVAGEVERRFDQPDLKIIKDLEMLLLQAANGELCMEQGYMSEALSSYIEGDIDGARLRVQLPMLPDMIKTAFDGSIKKVTTLRTLTDAMNKSNIYKGMLSEVDKLLKVYFTFPVTSATAERAFSSLRRLKTFLRSTMTQCRLNNLFLLYIHTGMTDMLDLTKIAKEFVSVNSRRSNYFGLCV